MRICPACKLSHPGYISCARAKALQPVVKELVSQMEDEIMANTGVANVDTLANNMANTYKYRDAEKRREYMREYMRKRRAV